jgi:glyoxylase-like metal-dependent hydrolase (beta-lactamase superfamily II)
MILRCVTGGPLETNCYIVGCDETFEALVIDPGLTETECKEVLRKISKLNLQVKYIVNTHGHPDHILSNGMIKDLTGAKVLVHEEDAHLLKEPWTFPFEIGQVQPIEPDGLLRDGDIIKIGILEFTVIHTPGHTKGSVSLYCESENVVFTGDTLFYGSVGRTDLPGGSIKDIKASLRDKLMKLPDRTIVYPGHGAKTTVGREKRFNPFL